MKIVDRRTFESDKAFQREFEGMAQFEPISRERRGLRGHPARRAATRAGGFFYYVMELADDHLGGERDRPGALRAEDAEERARAALAAARG